MILLIKQSNFDRMKLFKSLMYRTFLFINTQHPLNQKPEASVTVIRKHTEKKGLSIIYRKNIASRSSQS